MPKELKNPNHSANLSKFGHDMSKIVKFSSTVGQLLPLYYDHLLPGDKVKFNVDMFTQMADVVSPAMLNLTEQIDWFFVPYSQLYQFANDNMFSIDDSASAYRPHLGEPSVFPMVEDVELFSMHSIGDYKSFDNPTIGYILNWADGETLQIKFGLPALSPGGVTNPCYDMFGVPKLYNAIRLLQHLGFGECWDINPENQDDDLWGRFYNPSLLLAYHKIFFDHYRLSDRTPNNVKSYNVDDLSGNVQLLIENRSDDWLTIHYVPWKRDFFTSTHVAPLIDNGSIGMQSQDGERLTKVVNWLSLGTAVNNNGNGVANLSVGGSSAGTNVTSTALLRSMFAVEKLMEITRRAAKHYDAQVLAHLGFKVPDGVASEVYRLGSDSNQIVFKEIVALANGTAGDSTSTLGQKGGKGQGFKSNKDKSFVAPCHGILMAVYHARPDADYDCKMLDKFNTFGSRAEYFHPEFDRMGQEPLFRYQATGTQGLTRQVSNEICGWNWRYMPYKLKYNQCYGAFVYSYPYRNWTVYRDMSPFFDNPDDSEFNEGFFYVSPFSIDSVMLVNNKPNYSSDVVLADLSSVYARDNMLHWFRFNVFKSSIISNYSLPSL